MEGSTEMPVINEYLDFCESLMEEIRSLKETLIAADYADTTPVDIIDQHAERISQALPTDPDTFCLNFPIHELLSVGPLTKIEIPVEILKMLALAPGLHMNNVDMEDKTCLQVAIEKKHYKAVKHLVELGADCNLIVDDDSIEGGKTPIAWLASCPDVRLDLFDVLKTDDNLNNPSCINLPLHTAVSFGHIASVHYLIKLGADVNQHDDLNMLPIEHYIKKYTHELNEELFEVVTPTSPSCSNGILKGICRALDEVPRNPLVRTKILNRLLPLLIPTHPLPVTISVKFKGIDNDLFYLFLFLNVDVIVEIVLCDFSCQRCTSLQRVYKISLLLYLLDVDIISVPDAIAPHFADHPEIANEQMLKSALAVDRVWNNYRNRPTVRSLLRLCILKIRNLMKSLSDESFKSLPISMNVRKLLMYHDVAEIVCV